MGAPFMRVFRGLNDGTAGDMEPITIGYRDEEFIYIVPQSDRVLITYAINFKDPTDQALAKVFLQEFADAQRTFRKWPTGLLQ